MAVKSGIVYFNTPKDIRVTLRLRWITRLGFAHFETNKARTFFFLLIKTQLEAEVQVYPKNDKQPDKRRFTTASQKKELETVKAETSGLDWRDAVCRVCGVLTAYWWGSRRMCDVAPLRAQEQNRAPMLRMHVLWHTQAQCLENARQRKLEVD